MAVELLAIGVYFGLTEDTIRSVRYVLYPFIWINAGLWAVHRRPAPSAGRRARWTAGALAAGYFLVLASLSGLVSAHLPTHVAIQTAGVLPQLPVAHGSAGPTDLVVELSKPGWGPRIAYVGADFHVQFIPYRVIGYLALSYLVYGAVLDTTGAALPGVVGLASCIGCTVPLAAPAAIGLGGGIAAATVGLSVDISTAAFLAAVVLLYWRPGAGRAGPNGR